MLDGCGIEPVGDPCFGPHHDSVVTYSTAIVLNTVDRGSLASLGPSPRPGAVNPARPIACTSRGVSSQDASRPKRMSDDPYQVLGVSRDSSPAEVEAAWRALAWKHHPDQVAGGPGGQALPDERPMSDINAARNQILVELRAIEGTPQAAGSDRTSAANRQREDSPPLSTRPAGEPNVPEDSRRGEVSSVGDHLVGLLVLSFAHPLGWLVWAALIFGGLSAAGVITTSDNQSPAPVHQPVGPDRDCSDYSGPVAASPDDPYNLDADSDGIGCER